MIALVSLLVTVALSVLLTRVATVALQATGLSQQAAWLEARSAILGAGFSSEESEAVLANPARRPSSSASRPWSGPTSRTSCS